MSTCSGCIYWKPGDANASPVLIGPSKSQPYRRIAVEYPGEWGICRRENHDGASFYSRGADSATLQTNADHSCAAFEADNKLKVGDETKLRTLAEWLDGMDWSQRPGGAGDEVQRDLRRIAAAIERSGL